MLLASFGDVTYCLYTDPADQEVETLDVYEGEKILMLYAKRRLSDFHARIRSP